jgi:DNA-binding NarL/FixJ family response regulator
LAVSPPNSHLRVLIADSAPTRFGVRLALDGVVTICGEAGDRQRAVELAQELWPDVCLIGRGLPGGGLETVREICRSLPETAVIVLAHNDYPNDVLAFVRAGAIGYVPAGSDPPNLRRVILAVEAAEPAIPRAMVRELVDEIRGGARAGAGNMTLRDYQVLAMLRGGASTAAIAEGLEISPVTVRRHISVLARKAGVTGRSALLSADGHPATRSVLGTSTRGPVI